jgi:hypothetical protein
MDSVSLKAYRQGLSERSRLDEQDELALARSETPAERFEMAVELSELLRELAEAADAHWTREPAQDLSDKAALYALPLRSLRRNE